MPGTPELDVFDPERNFVEVEFISGRPIVDGELNEAQQIRRYFTENFAKSIFGSGPIGDGFKVLESVNNNEFIVQNGVYYYKGTRLEFHEPLVVTGLATPLVIETYLVYVDFHEEQVDALTYPDIIAPSVGAETAVRRKITASVGIAINSTVPAPAPGHTRFRIATIIRPIGDPSITTAMIDDERYIVRETYVKVGAEIRETGGLTADLGPYEARIHDERYQEPVITNLVFPDSTTTYLYIDSVGVLQTASSLPVDPYPLALYRVVTDATDIIEIQDLRIFSSEYQNFANALKRSLDPTAASQTPTQDFSDAWLKDHNFDGTHKPGATVVGDIGQKDVIDLRPEESTPADYTIYVNPGTFPRSNGEGTNYWAGGQTETFDLPSAPNRRIDLVGFTDDNRLVIIRGTFESPNPKVDPYPDDIVVVAEVELRWDDVSIQNSRIRDVRPWINSFRGATKLTGSRVVYTYGDDSPPDHTLLGFQKTTDGISSEYGYVMPSAGKIIAVTYGLKNLPGTFGYLSLIDMDPNPGLGLRDGDIFILSDGIITVPFELDVGTPATAVITAIDPSLIIEGETFVLHDINNADDYTFVFDKGTYSGPISNIVDISSAVNADDVAIAIQDAISGSFSTKRLFDATSVSKSVNIQTRYSGGDTVAENTDTVLDAGFVLTQFAGGSGNGVSPGRWPVLIATDTEIANNIANAIFTAVNSVGLGFQIIATVNTNIVSFTGPFSSIVISEDVPAGGGTLNAQVANPVSGIRDRDTFIIQTQSGLTTFEFDTNGSVSSGTVPVSLPTPNETVGVVRTAMITAINTVGPGLGIVASPGVGPSQIVITGEYLIVLSEVISVGPSLDPVRVSFNPKGMSGGERIKLRRNGTDLNVFFDIENSSELVGVLNVEKENLRFSQGDGLGFQYQQIPGIEFSPSEDLQTSILVAFDGYPVYGPVLDELRVSFAGPNNRIWDMLTGSYTLSNNSLQVYRNGKLLSEGREYLEISPTRVEFLYVLRDGDHLRFLVPKPNINLDDDTPRLYEQQFPINGQQDFELKKGYFKPGTKQLKVWRNGKLLNVGVEYSELSAIKIRLNGYSAKGGDIFTFRVD